MSQQLINTGTNANDGTGDSLRIAGNKINSNFTELYARPTYTLPTASQSNLGGVKVGSTLQINPTTALLDINASLNNLTDTEIQSPVINQFLKFNGTQWVNSALPVIPVQLDNLTDVTITTPSNGEFLKFNGTNWVNSPSPNFTVQLDNITDVSITAPSNGQFLKFDGSIWVNSLLPAIPSQLDNLTDVTISSPVVGQVLKFNGSQWINAADERQVSTNVFNQTLNKTDNVEFNTTKSQEYILDGVGTPTLESNTDINLSAVGKVKIITKSPFSMATMTTAQRDALVGVGDGDVIYNSSINKFQGRAAGVWVDLH